MYFIAFQISPFSYRAKNITYILLFNVNKLSDGNSF